MGRNLLGISFDRVELMNRALDGAWKRIKVLNHNLSNVNTPGYKRKDVDFQSVLKKEMDDSSGFKIKDSGMVSKEDAKDEFQVEVEGGYSTRRDGNNVNADTEMAELTKNYITYNSLIGQTSKEFKKWKMIIDEGGR
jgi:flagellar basal-body rod protein FlgB